jgi:hypothetical protein
MAYVRLRDGMTVAQMQALKTSERRSDRRNGSHELKVTFLGGDYTAINWSRTGFLAIDRIPHIPVGTVIEGFLKVPGCDGRYRFTAELSRRDQRAFEIAFRFLDPSSAMLGALTRTTDFR